MNWHALNFSNPPEAHPPVRVAFEMEKSHLVVRFEVTCEQIFAKSQLEKNEFPYEFDVVELFVRNLHSDKPDYYEFEVSPYNQGLQVNVVEPRREFYFGVKNGFTHSAKIAPPGWVAGMKIPLATIGCRAGQKVELVGNAYAALGMGPERVYWSLFELPPGKPDFHLPASFRPLF